MTAKPRHCCIPAVGDFSSTAFCFSREEAGLHHVAPDEVDAAVCWKET
jgi:hypothetical protein